MAIRNVRNQPVDREGYNCNRGACGKNLSPLRILTKLQNAAQFDLTVTRRCAEILPRIGADGGKRPTSALPIENIYEFQSKSPHFVARFVVPND
jgi:hypothetical protein